MAIHIRRGRRTDFADLSELAGWPGVEGSSARSVRLFRRVISDLAYDLYVADEDGRAVGVVAVSYVRALPLGGQRAMLEELIVRPGRRRSGIGRELLEFVFRRAVKRGALAFEARPNGEEAERFLDRTGFRPSGKRYLRELWKSAERR